MSAERSGLGDRVAAAVLPPPTPALPLPLPLGRSGSGPKTPLFLLDAAFFLKLRMED